jgi:hypothetical protein
MSRSVTSWIVVVLPSGRTGRVMHAAGGVNLRERQQLIPADGEVVEPCNRCSLTMITYKQQLGRLLFLCGEASIGGAVRW